MSTRTHAQPIEFGHWADDDTTIQATTDQIVTTGRPTGAKPKLSIVPKNGNGRKDMMGRLKSPKKMNGAIEEQRLNAHEERTSRAAMIRDLTFRLLPPGLEENQVTDFLNTELSRFAEELSRVYAGDVTVPSENLPLLKEIREFGMELRDMLTALLSIDGSELGMKVNVLDLLRIKIGPEVYEYLDTDTLKKISHVLDDYIASENRPTLSQILATLSEIVDGKALLS